MAGVLLLPNLEPPANEETWRGVAGSRVAVGRLPYRATTTAWIAVRLRGAPGLAVAGVAVLAAKMVEGRRVPVRYRSSLLRLQRRKSKLHMEQKGSANIL
jgi:hypothetical protein